MLAKGAAKKVTIYINEDSQRHLNPLYESILSFLIHKGVAGATATIAATSPPIWPPQFPQWLIAPQRCRQSDLALSPAGPPSLFLPKRLHPHGCALSAFFELLRHLGFDPERAPKSRCRVGADRSASFPPQSGNSNAEARSLVG
jgi:Uncharacterized ACR, COG1993